MTRFPVGAGRDVASLSHDLRRTLTLIIGHLELLEEDAESDPELAERHLDVIEAYSGRLLALVREARLGR